MARTRNPSPTAARQMTRHLLPVLFAVSAATALHGQAPTSPPQRIAANDQQVVQALIGFARSAESYKQPSRARQVYEQILDHYDVTNATARKGLGWQQVKGEWQAPTKPQFAADTATPDQRKKVDEAWRLTARKVTKLHRDLGLALLAEQETTLGRPQLERALAFDPEDKDSHKALGHAQVDGFYGTTEQLAFVQRMRDIFGKARELRSQEFEVTTLGQNQTPKELLFTGLTFLGGRSPHFQHWVVDSAEATFQTLQWAERSLALGQFLLPEASAHSARPEAIQWFGLVRTHEQRDLLLERSPKIRGKYTLEEAQLFSGWRFGVGSGSADVSAIEQPNDADQSVAMVTKRCLVGGRNTGLGEGLMHASTWLLCGSTLTFYCDLPKTFSGNARLLPRDPKAWLSRLQDEIEAGTDYPLVQIPRQRSDNFHESARIKSWSFMLWLVARHPDRWHKLLDKLSTPDLLPEDVTKVFATVLERDLGEVEDEWRAWARRGSRIGKASGLID